MSAKTLLSCRDVLWWMIFSGIAVNFMLRVNLTLVIVAIVKSPEKPVVQSQCHQFQVNQTEDVNDPALIILNKTSNETSQVYNWNEYEQGLLIGAYYWIHWLSEIPGGIFARKYGTKVIFGIGNLLVAVLGFLLPLTMRYEFYVLILLRVLQGLIAGVAYPAMHDITAKWIPSNERSKFVSAYQGSSIGIALTYPLSGFIIDSLGWEFVFYLTSLLGVIWYVFWYFLVYDDPLKHPRITPEERKHILDNIGDSVDYNHVKSAIPWKGILTSSAVWIAIFSNWSVVWGYFTLMSQAPAYFKFVHGWSINKTGIWSGFPHILTMIFGWFFGYMCDWLLKNDKLSLTNVRKLATCTCTGIPGLMVLGLAFSGCYPGLAAFFMFFAIASIGAVASGPLTNLVDISPNYASVLLGICGLIVDIAGFLSPFVVGLLTNKNQTIGRWQLIFIISSLNMGAGCIVYFWKGTAEQQSWNNYSPVAKDDEKDKKPSIEMEKFT